MPQPYKVFTIYAREDAQYLEELRGQLRPLEIAGRIKVWSDREINPGVDWEKEIVQKLDTADIVLILVSSAYYNSVYIHEVEIKYALARHERGETKVLPIIVRPVGFGDDPIISRLQVLPTDGKAVTDKRHWPERDEAWLDVVTGVKRTLALLDDADNKIIQAALAAEQAEVAAKERKQLDQKAKIAATERKQLDQKAAEQAEAAAIERKRLDQKAVEQRKQAEKKQREEEKENASKHERQKEEQRLKSERISQTKLEQENTYKRTHESAWQRASSGHSIASYQAYLAQYPNGELQKEAHFRIKTLKKAESDPVPWHTYKALAVAALSLICIVWSAMYMWGGKAEPEAKLTAPAPEFNYPMIAVAGGTFLMGSPKNEKDRYDYECQHKVLVPSFSVGKYEVTQAQWREIMGTDPPELGFKGCDDCPVESVSWNDVQEFIKTLNKVTKSGNKYRLPTEIEWEYAARGGQKASSPAKLYAGSNDLSNVAWYSDNSVSKTRPVGKKMPNELGLYDMSGNVWEWCDDLYYAYTGCVTNDEEGRYRVLRGGSWGDDRQRSRSACRHALDPSYRDYFIGFRLAHQ